MPLYEDSTHAAAQAALAVQVQLAWGCHLEKMAPQHAFDYRAYRDGVVVALVEVKRKRGSVRRLGCLYVDVDKVTALNAAARVEHARGIFVVQFDDGVFYVATADIIDCDQVVAGRSDRADDFDRDAAYLVPLARVKALLTRNPLHCRG